MPFVSAHGVTLHYRIDGDEALPLLVLSNGLGTELAMWDPQIPALARAFRVLRYDTRGHGRSSTPAQPFALEHLGRDVLALLDHAGADRAHFCGLSMGGMTGMWLGIHAPDRLASLTLANTAARIGPPAMWNERIDVVNSQGMTAISDAAVARWFTPDFIARQPGTVAGVKAAFERTPAEGYVRCCATVRDTDLREAIVRITTPVLVLCGAHDVATPPADGHVIAQRIAGARAVTLDAAHLSNLEAPREFSATLLAFCRANDAVVSTALRWAR
jgi:3-oxoadipate enol-lactonase